MARPYGGRPVHAGAGRPRGAVAGPAVGGAYRTAPGAAAGGTGSFLAEAGLGAFGSLVGLLAGGSIAAADEEGWRQIVILSSVQGTLAALVGREVASPGS